MTSDRPKRSHVAALGLTAAGLFSGSCGGSNLFNHVPVTAFEGMSHDERARAELLRSLYEEVLSGILKNSPEELAGIIEPMRHGIKAQNTTFVGGDDQNQTSLYVKGKNGSDDYHEQALSINIEPLKRRLKNMTESEIWPPSETEIRDVFVQAIHSALMNERYKGLVVGGLDMQKSLQNPLLKGVIEKILSENVAWLIREHIDDISHATAMAESHYPQKRPAPSGPVASR